MPLRPVREIMTRSAIARCAPDESVGDACRKMDEGCCGSVLVCEGDRLVGIFTERDLVRRVVAKGKDPARTRLRDVMTIDPVTIGPDQPVREAIRIMDEGSFRYLPVVEEGKVVGIVSARDLPYEEIGRMARMLELEHSLAERIW
ncbi:MAG: CBS domain-containing protein [Geminicoccaceae bacterium]|nr:CBS domain-containing protein [Geminicoccaceae bacterium]MCS7266418.1 CBS domain-containing protein [Geminicoccaceae bacterium]MCX7630452.1 CBS domain-containing protein [Geminicoccaceae bacterium]MDW8124554.1 CBS domain-containing protein [Geminicoccaceae bacterium]MDW8341091.1 CBS domain-containing protein [Geminicoccaceae bacterium]